MSKKTILEWYELLPEKERRQATANATKTSTIVTSLADAIFEGFVWSKTPEGTEYWLKIWKRY